MSNTYFKIKKEVHTRGLKVEYSYTNVYELALTAFVGGENIVQLTVTTRSSVPNQSGTGYIVLGREDINKLIGALSERTANLISATSDERSIFCTEEDLD